MAAARPRSRGGDAAMAPAGATDAGAAGEPRSRSRSRSARGSDIIDQALLDLSKSGRSPMEFAQDVAAAAVLSSEVENFTPVEKWHDFRARCMQELSIGEYEEVLTKLRKALADFEKRTGARLSLDFYLKFRTKSRRNTAKIHFLQVTVGLGHADAFKTVLAHISPNSVAEQAEAVVREMMKSDRPHIMKLFMEETGIEIPMRDLRSLLITGAKEGKLRSLEVLAAAHADQGYAAARLGGITARDIETFRDGEPAEGDTLDYGSRTCVQEICLLAAEAGSHAEPALAAILDAFQLEDAEAWALLAHAFEQNQDHLAKQVLLHRPGLNEIVREARFPRHSTAEASRRRASYLFHFA